MTSETERIFPLASSAETPIALKACAAVEVVSLDAALKMLCCSPSRLAVNEAIGTSPCVTIAETVWIEMPNLSAISAVASIADFMPSTIFSAARVRALPMSVPAAEATPAVIPILLASRSRISCAFLPPSENCAISMPSTTRSAPTSA